MAFSVVRTAMVDRGSFNASSKLITGITATAGTLVIFAVTIWKSSGAPTAMTATGSVDGAYTQAFLKVGSSKQTVGLYYFIGNTVTSIGLTIAPSGGGAGTAYDYAVFQLEVSGHKASEPIISGTAATNGATSSSAASGSTTPADTDVMLVAALGYDAGGTITPESSPWVEAAENEASSGLGQPGSLVYRILSGAPSGSYQHTWTLGSSGEWADGIAAFKAASSTPSATVPFVNPADQRNVRHRGRRLAA